MFIAEQLVYHWKNISTARVLTKLLMSSQIVRTPDPIRSSILPHFKGQNIIPLESTFDVLSVDLLLVPFVGFLALGLQILNALESRNLK